MLRLDGGDDEAGAPYFGNGDDGAGSYDARAIAYGHPALGLDLDPADRADAVDRLGEYAVLADVAVGADGEYLVVVFGGPLA